MQRIKYTGQGGDLFPDVHWAPTAGEERDFSDEEMKVLLDGDGHLVHPDLKAVKAAAKSEQEGPKS